MTPPLPITTEVPPSTGVIENKFLIVAIACRRVIQLRDGARPHLEARGHKPCVMAVAEVIAGTVAYSLV
jgi:DNA-directed RNA polymerase subunit K/omega